jgi:hypothetical protein
VVAACSAHAPPVVPPAQPAQPPPQAFLNRGRSCREAAVGLERATRGVRPPESSIARVIDQRCRDDDWPLTAADCFAKIAGEDELSHCAGMLPDGARRAVLDVIAGGGGRAAIAVAKLRLSTLQVGVGACDRFVTAVATMLGCEQMPVDARVELGNATAELWDLPTTGLSDDAQQRMSDVCGSSLAELQAQATTAGCTL